MSRKKKRGTKLAYVQRHGNGFRGWYIENGRQRRGPTMPTEEEAHRWSLRMREEVERRGKGQLTLQEGMDLVLREVELTGRREGTRRRYVEQFKLLARAWDPSIPLAKIDKREVEWFIERRSKHINPATGKPISATTVRHNLQGLNRIFALAVREGFVSENPVSRVRKPSAEEKPRDHFTREEVEELLAWVRRTNALRADSDADADMIELLFVTGIRRTEFSHIRISDIDLKGRELRIKHGKRRPRTLPIPFGMVPLLERISGRAARADVGASGRLEWDGEGRGRYIVAGTSEERRVNTVTRTFKRWKTKLDEPRLHPHAMRHSFITYLARRGFPEHVIAALSGHKLSSSSITQHYVAVHGPDVQRAMACFWDDGGGGAVGEVA